MEYILQSSKDGRVFIDSHLHDACVPERIIHANTWCDARDKVNTDEFVPCPGYGFFLDFFQSNRG